tara:strand:+ start:118 stop:384 length:267 start_codon:yes stop_codon:yes gene_type:complete
MKVRNKEQKYTIKNLIDNELYKLRRVSNTRGKTPVVPDQYLLILAEAEIEIVKDMVLIEGDDSNYWKDKSNRVTQLIKDLQKTISHSK